MALLPTGPCISDAFTQLHTSGEAPSSQHARHIALEHATFTSLATELPAALYAQMFTDIT